MMENENTGIACLGCMAAGQEDGVGFPWKLKKEVPWTLCLWGGGEDFC